MVNYIKNEKSKNELSLEEIKIIQMDILSAIHQFCVDNGITYSLACGTLLGAIRHKGYIPWDDDIDIYMWRTDYNKLLSIFPEVYQGRYKLASLERDKYWTRSYANAYDDSTICYENTTEKSVIGVKIDIFPIDQVPEEKKDWEQYDRKRRFFSRFHEMRFGKLWSKKNLLKNISFLLVKSSTLIIPQRKTAILLSKYAQKYNATDSSYVFSNSQGIVEKSRFKKEYFDSVIDLPFEDRTYKGFAQFDEYLKSAYGNYWELPPIEQRVTHHSSTAYRK